MKIKVTPRCECPELDNGLVAHWASCIEGAQELASALMRQRAALEKERDNLRSVLTELLRLYDWRFELAAEEKALVDSIPAAPVGWDEHKKKLNRYGLEKKAAWARARGVLAESVSTLPTATGNEEK